MTLHIINQSPRRSDSLQQCQSVSLPGDGIILIEDAAEAVADELLSTRFFTVDSTVRYFVLVPDLSQTNMIPSINNVVQPVDFNGFLELCEQHYPVVSW